MSEPPEPKETTMKKVGVFQLDPLGIEISPIRAEKITQLDLAIEPVLPIGVTVGLPVVAAACCCCNCNCSCNCTDAAEAETEVLVA